MAISLAVSATVQTPLQVTPTAQAATGLKPQKRTFSLTGVMGTGVLNGDAVALWGSNDGGTTYQPIRQNGAPVQLNFAYPEIVIDDACDHYGTNRVSVAPGSTLAAVGLNGEAASNPLVQAGTTTLVTGTKTVSGVILTPASIIVAMIRDPGAGALTNMASLDAPVASRNVAVGSFVINCVDAPGGATIATAVPTVDWIIVG